jgi:hypothetical protein
VFRYVILATVAALTAGCISTAAAPPAPRPGQALPVAGPARGALTVVARQDPMGDVPLKRLAAFKGYFDVIQPGPAAPGHWDAGYRLQLTRDKVGTLGPVIAVWVSVHNRFPARKVTARPRFDGRQWLLWVSPTGQYTFTLPYPPATEPAHVYSTRALERRWTYGTVDFRDMLRWLKASEYLPDGMRLGSVTFGWDFDPPAPPGEFTVRKYTLTVRAR